MSASSHPQNHGRRQAGPRAGQARAPSPAVHESEEPDPVVPFLADLAELREYLDYYIDVRIDQLRVGIRAAIVSVAISIGAVAVAGTALATAVVLFLRGLAGLVGDLSGRGHEVGDTIVGGILLIGAGAGAWVWARRRQAQEQKRVIEKYEHRKQAERDTFGTDVSQQAAS
jgi:hypothetical protein